MEFVTEIPFLEPGEEEPLPLHRQPAAQTRLLSRRILIRTVNEDGPLLRSYVLDSLIHEILHVAVEVAGYRARTYNEEAVVSAISPRLTDIITDVRNRPLLALFG